MTDEPGWGRDERPDQPGWWLASDGKWYPPESAPTAAVPDFFNLTQPLRGASRRATRGAGSWLRAVPLWAKILAPLAIVVLIAGVAAASSGDSHTSASHPPSPAAALAAPTSTSEMATVPTSTTPAPTTLPPTTRAPARAAPTTSPTTSIRPPSTTAAAPPPAAHAVVTTLPPTTCPNGSSSSVGGDSECVAYSPPVGSGAPAGGATAKCKDGAYSFSQHRQGTCSNHGGVAVWLASVP